MSIFDDEYSYCNVNPADDSIIPATLSTTHDNAQLFYYIKINAEIIHPPSQDDDNDQDEDDDFPDYMNMDTDTRDMEIFVPIDQVIGTGPHTSRFLISNHLCRVGIPTHVLPIMIDQISSCARQMESANRSVGRKVLPMSVFVSYMADDDELDEDREEGYGTEDQEFVTVGASEAAVEGLKKVVVEEGNVKCSICLEDMEVGEEGKKMECEHCFHGDCIVDWLRVGNVCPLCRFQLPAAEAEIADDDDH